MRKNTRKSSKRNNLCSDDEVELLFKVPLEYKVFF